MYEFFRIGAYLAEIQLLKTLQSEGPKNRSAWKIVFEVIDQMRFSMVLLKRNRFVLKILIGLSLS